MLDMDVLIVCKCRDTGKVTTYTSGDNDADRFTIEKAMREIEAWTTKGRIVKLYDNSDYEKLRTQKNDQMDEEVEEIEPPQLPRKRDVTSRHTDPEIVPSSTKL